jgi:uncharacterized phage protein (TIGR01671 family)
MNFKCRAWDSVKEEYIYSDQIAGGMWRFFKTLEDRGIRHFESEFATGLKDLKGVEIYAGDIVKCHEKERYQRNLTSYNTEIIFNNGMFLLKRTPNGWNKMYLSILSVKVEIIGNIHKNMDLVTPCP